MYVGGGQVCVEAVYAYMINCGNANTGYSQVIYPAVSTAVPVIANMTFGYSVAINGNFMTVGAPSASE
jgi:hypothetical protein